MGREKVSPAEEEEARLMNEWVDLLNQSVAVVDPDARAWLTEHGTAKKEQPRDGVFLEIKDKFDIGQPLSLVCGPGGLSLIMEDEHGRTFSYRGTTKFERLVKVPKGWGVVFLDSNNRALVVSERGTFEQYEDARFVLDAWLMRP